MPTESKGGCNEGDIFLLANETKSVPKNYPCLSDNNSYVFFDFCFQVFILCFLRSRTQFTMTFESRYKNLPNGLTLVVCKNNQVFIYI